LAEGPIAWGVRVVCVAELVRVVSHPRLFNPPSPTKAVLEKLRTLLGSPSARLLVPGPRHLDLFAKLVAESAATGDLVFDAQIVALCLENGASTLVTEDRDFARFPGLRTRRILAPQEE
jgi:predicted nucleic acid-binding protein